MEKLDVLIWALGGGFVLVLGALKIIWNEIKETHKRIDKLDEKAMDIDRRLCRIEGSLSSKDCCMLKESRSREKVE